MVQGYVLLIGTCILAIGVVLCNMKNILKNPYKLLRSICFGLFTFSLLRYFTLIVYGDSPSYEQLVHLRIFYFATSIGLTMTTASAIWYVTPFYRERWHYGKYLAFFIPWILFYLWLIVKQPTRIIQGKYYGYILQLLPPYEAWLASVQSIFVGVAILLCVLGMLRHKHIEIRVKLFILILAQLILLLDGLTYYLPLLHTFAPFTVSEVLGFLAVLYGFSGFSEKI
ncbi:hypothetical protein CS063_03665 [Sporanaerobium hydrogeniformans]|uniref:Uncharacterized protein n=1 Tax=Sporanaerobium hydrogeniformans TaxID=3072179 RepID=A0AC61DEP3_9FIRM|nr:hypothetical protein [Sporanaerobium hydrogeniformans]PHV71670.1 hypothetical protein CS063_03665 [Sporanaerobium hydrogeniformans]